MPNTMETPNHGVCWGSWDVMGFRTGGGGSKYSVDPDTVRRLISSRIPKPSNHDRMEGKQGWKTEEKKTMSKRGLGMASPPVREPVVSMPVSPKPMVRRRSNSFDDESINFPSYDDFVKVAESEETCKATVTLMEIIDDTFLQHHPTIHVDYLSHDWIEEDIWASWKHITSKGKAYTNGPRLQNAAWRLWGKKKADLKTIPPETIKWTKDLDVTWLYGPLQEGTTQTVDAAPSRMGDSGIDLGLPKPILKTPSLAEVLLQRSLCNSPVSRRPSPSAGPSLSNSPWKPEKSNVSGTSTPSGTSSTREKNVRFHEEVAQCVALVQPKDFDEEDLTCHFVSEEDFDGVSISRSDSPSSLSSESLKTIELLPPTLLKPEGQLKQKPEAVKRSVSWPSRSLSSWSEDLLPPPATHIMNDDDVDWISPIPKEPSKTQRLDKLPLMTEDELYEIEMFGSIQQSSHAIHSSFTHPIDTTPSVSEYPSSTSSDQDEEDYLSFRGETFTPPPPVSRPQFGRSMSTNDLSTFEYGKSSDSRHEAPSFSFFDAKEQTERTTSTSTSFMFQPRPAYGLQGKKCSAVVHTSQFELSAMDDDEDHWWMNV